MNRRVVVTGMGAVTPIGNNVIDTFENVKKGQCGIKPITSFDVSDFKVKVAASCEINVEDFLDKKEIKRMDRFTQLGMIAAKQAIESSGILESNYNKEKIGVLVGSGIGGINSFETEVRRDNLKRVSPFVVPMMIGNILPGRIAIEYGFKGHCSCVVTACSTGNNAIGDAFDLIRFGKLDAVVAGGSEAAIGPIELAGFANMMALSQSDDPKRASIPFDKERNGFVMGEGAGILVLEEYESAKKRGANILAEIVGYGSTCDAYHITAPHPEGEGAIRSMQMALDDAGIKPQDIDYINAHGTSTPMNDRIETLAIKQVFKDCDVPVSSTKSMTGHLLGAAGSVEAIISIMSIREGFIPPTIGHKVFDEECDLDIVPNVGRKKEIKYALSNSFGFGGHNVTLTFKKYFE